MRTVIGRSQLAALLALGVCGCGEPSRYAVVTLRDPQGVAQGATTLSILADHAPLRHTALGGTRFPVTVGFSSTRDEDPVVTLEAQDASGRALGRARVTLRLRAGRTDRADAELAAACARDEDCDDGVYCNGRGLCSDGVCSVVPPCVSPLACVQLTCNEALRACDVILDHSSCPANTACQRDFGCVPCNARSCTGPSFCDTDAASPSFGECVSCDTPTHCGPSCAACPPTTPLCAGASAGCVCDESPAPRGSCGPGTRCIAGACVACDDVAYCGAECADCTLTPATNACGGVQGGCVAPDCSVVGDFSRCPSVSKEPFGLCARGVCAQGPSFDSLPGPEYAIADLIPGWRLPPTGASSCFDAAQEIPCAPLPCNADGSPNFCGQDVQYAPPSPASRWTRSAGAEPVVGDTVTGLLWEGCAHGLTGAQCELGFPTFATPEEAAAACEASTYAGYPDWRLARDHDFLSVMDAALATRQLPPELFPNVDYLGLLLTATDYNMLAGIVSRVNLEGGTLESFPGSDVGAFYCVRSLTPLYSRPPTPHFTVSEPTPGEPVVADHFSGLTWQRCVAGLSGDACELGSASALTWAQALRYCEALSWAGATDWRVPNRSEVWSTMGYATRNFFTADLVPSPPYGALWSSTTVPASPTIAYSANPDNGMLWVTAKTSTSFVRCVR